LHVAREVPLHCGDKLYRLRQASCRSASFSSRSSIVILIPSVARDGRTG
jgi:hypothetical protein